MYVALVFLPSYHSLLLGSGVNNLALTHLCFIDRDTGKDVPGLQ